MLMILSLLVRLAFMVTSTGVWQRLINNPQLGLPQSSTSIRGARAKPKAGFMFNVWQWPVLVPGGVSFAQKPHWDPRTESHQGGRNSARAASTTFTDPRKKGSPWDSVPDVLQCSILSSSSSSSSSSVANVGTLSELLDQWRSITFRRFVLNMVKGQHLQIRCHPFLFHNFIWFNIKASMAHLPVTHKQVDVILAKGAGGP